MAVLVEAISVVVPIAVLEAKYPGGVAQYERDCTNHTFCADANLTSIRFMLSTDVKRFIERLTARGLDFVAAGSCVDIVVVDQHQGPTAPCAWIEGGHQPEGYAAVWMGGTEPGELAHPEGWTPTQSSQLEFASHSDMDRFLRLGRTSRVDIVVDFKTGRQVYIGRSFPEQRSQS